MEKIEREREREKERERERFDTTKSFVEELEQKLILPTYI